jgi:hypothetical protein
MDGIVGAAARPPCPPAAGLPAETNEQTEDLNTYRWIPGECINEYSKSAATWKSHTSSPEFAEAFQATAA